MKITTDRLIIRPFQRDDFEDLHRMLSDPDVMRFSFNGPYSKQKSADFLSQCMEKSKNKQPSLLAVIDRRNRLFMGSCGFFPQKIQGKEELELGYRFLKKHWGKGFATEAATAVKDYAFNEMGLTRLISLIEKENIASVRVAEKNGFKLENEIIFAGKIHLCIYSICN